MPGQVTIDALTQLQGLGLRSSTLCFRRIFSRSDALDVMFTGLIAFALVADGLRLR